MTSRSPSPASSSSPRWPTCLPTAWCWPTASPAAPSSISSGSAGASTSPSCSRARPGDRPDPQPSAVAPQTHVGGPRLALRGLEVRPQPVGGAVRPFLGVAVADLLDVEQAALDVDVGEQPAAVAQVVCGVGPQRDRPTAELRLGVLL